MRYSVLLGEPLLDHGQVKAILLRDLLRCALEAIGRAIVVRLPELLLNILVAAVRCTLALHLQTYTVVRTDTLPRIQA